MKFNRNMVFSANQFMDAMRDVFLGCLALLVLGSYIVLWMSNWQVALGLTVIVCAIIARAFYLRAKNGPELPVNDYNDKRGP